MPDADFSQLPALYGRPIELVHKATDGKGGKFVNKEITDKLHVEVLGGWFDLGFNNWFSTRKPLNSLADLKGMKLRSPGGVLNSFRIRYLRRHSECHCVAGRAAGDVAGHVRRADQHRTRAPDSSKLYDSGMRYSLQDQQGMGLYVPLVNQAFWTKLGPKLQETMLKLWIGQPAGLARQQREGAGRTRVTELTQHGVKFVDVPQAELDAAHAKMVAEQDKAVADAHISPELVKLVMADVGV